MSPREPRTILPTHEVTNQPDPLEDYNLYDNDAPLREALEREGGAWAEDDVRAFGQELGRERVLALGHAANRYSPELQTFDRFGRRIDEVTFHPAWHELMALAIRHRVHAAAWTADRPGGHLLHTALEYMLIQVEAGVCCPMAMTYASIPALRHQPEIAAQWEPKILSFEYDPRSLPMSEKTSATIGMAMTEKQGGSDVRANATRAQAIDGGGRKGAYLLTGHKWFCSAPMSDAFLTLAHTSNGLSCFLVPRWRPDGTRNAVHIQRLKDKLGNRSNASSEIEYADTWAQMVGEEGKGVRTIVDMVHHTRLDTALAAAGLMRQALVQAIHHCCHRTAFQRRLIQQPLMRSVLADLALECEAATAFVMRVARGFDAAAAGGDDGAFARVAVAVAKYWLNKRAPQHVYEAMECLGGAGYVEESILPRIYREVPVNSIWEGSGNVICLDVLRAIQRQPESLEAYLAEVEKARGADRRLDSTLDALRTQMAEDGGIEQRARRLTETMALALQASLLIRHAPLPVAEAFCAARLDSGRSFAFGGSMPETALDLLLERAWPAAA